MNKQSYVDLGFTSERVPAGSHTCLFYQDEAFKNRMILKYIVAGIRNGEKVICLTDSLTKEAILNWFRTEKVETGGNDPEQGLIVKSTRAAYFPKGYFHPEEMVARWRKYTEEAMAEGYHLLRATGEIHWLTAGIPGAERFLEYDLMLNERLKDLPVLLLCQFDTNRTPGAILMELLTVHPMVIINGQIMHNPLFHSPKGERPFFSGRKKGRYLCERISVVLLIVTVLLKTLPTSEKKVEFTANFLETVFCLKDYYLYLDGYTVKKGVWAERADPGCSEEFRIDIRTADSVFGYLYLPSRWGRTEPRLRPLLSNYLNLLALSLESTRYKEGLESLNKQLTAEIEERKKIEDRLRQNEQWTTLLRMQKLESLGMLASGIAHDFNNLLAAILSNVELAVFKLEKGQDGRKELQAIEKATLKAAKITKQLMAFAKGGAPVKQPAKLAEIIKETAEFALRGATVKCQYFLPADLWPVEVDGDQISQVIQNLMLNAYQAMPDGGVIKVSARNVVVSPQNPMWLRPGHYVRVEIEDQGAGIPAEMLTKVFDPYFTTKEEGHGLGLSSSYYIIQNHDGYLGVQSRVGEGSTFYFYLSAATAKPAVEQEGKKSIYPQGKGKVLLMDDEPMIRSTLREYLERCGYEIVVVKDGSEAVNLYAQEKKNQAPFDLVILDLTVPGGMGGKEAVRHILALDPEAKVVASSGYSDDPVMSEYQKFGFCGVLSKPFKMKELCAKIKGLLEPSQAN